MMTVMKHFVKAIKKINKQYTDKLVFNTNYENIKRWWLMILSSENIIFLIKNKPIKKINLKTINKNINS